MPNKTGRSAAKRQIDFFERADTDGIVPPLPAAAVGASVGDYPAPQESLFLALLLDPSHFALAGSRSRLICGKHGFTRPPIPAERLHVSLLGFGDYTEDRAAWVTALAATVRFPSFGISLDRALSFRGKGRHPFVLTGGYGVEGIELLNQVLRQTFLTGKQTRFRENSFRPHLTLVWEDQLVAEYPLEQPFEWRAQDFALVRSYRGHGRFDVLGRWPLSGTWDDRGA